MSKPLTVLRVLISVDFKQPNEMQKKAGVLFLGHLRMEYSDAEHNESFSRGGSKQTPVRTIAVKTHAGDYRLTSWAFFGTDNGERQVQYRECKAQESPIQTASQSVNPAYSASSSPKQTKDKMSL